MNRQRRCLVLMPFAPAFKEVYDQIYRPVCENNCLQCYRVDEVNTPGSITRDIVEGILDADLLIADLTARNPNVFYELGIAHATGNKTLMTAQSTKDIPFDIANYRVLLYEQTIAGAKRLYADLDAAIKAMLQSLERSNNPVQEVFSSRGGAKQPRRRLLMDVLRIDWLRKALREVIEGERWVYVDDLKGTDLEQLKAKYKFGPTVLGELCAIALKLGAVDAEEIHQIALKYKFDPTIRETVWKIE